MNCERHLPVEAPVFAGILAIKKAVLFSRTASYQCLKEKLPTGLEPVTSSLPWKKRNK